MNKEYNDYAITILNGLRLSGFSADIDFNERNLKSNFKQADRLNARYIILIGEDEVKNNILTVKNNQTKEEAKVELINLVEFLDSDFDGCDDDCCCCGDCEGHDH